MSDVSKNASMEQHRASQEGLGIGKLIESEQYRDAIHVAIVPVVAGRDLTPGDHVRVEAGRAFSADAYSDAIGIVDPFLRFQINAGQSFWLFLYPGSITSLRHVWTHPALGDEPGVAARPAPDKATSEAWLRNFCETADCPGYDAVMAVITNGRAQIGDSDYYGESYIEDEYIHFSGRDAHGDIPPEFWNHVEIVLGRKITERPTYFSCSC